MHLGVIYRIVALTLMFGWCAVASAAQLHVVIVGDTDCNIGEGIQHNIDLVETEIQRIADLTNLSLSETKITGEDYRPDLVLNCLKNLEVTEDDVVLLFLFGHGFSTIERTSIWPALDFGRYDAIELEDLVFLLYDKHPRFAFVMAEVCNHYIPAYAAPSFCQSRGWDLWEWFFPNTRRINYRELFLNQHGVMVVSSCKPGQRSWVSLKQGGVFTFALLHALEKQTEHPGASWEEIFSLAIEQTESFTKRSKKASLQSPQWLWLPFALRGF